MDGQRERERGGGGMGYRARSGDGWWTGRREEAALLVAQDDLTNEEIAARLGVTRRSLQVWKEAPEFAARVRELVTAMAEAVKGQGIAERQNRVAALNDRWEKLHGVIAARAKEMAGVPGGDTGLLVREVRLVKVYLVMPEGEGQTGGPGDGERAGGGGKWGQPSPRPSPRGRGGEREMEGDGEELGPGRRVVQVAEYAVDVGLLKELREHEKQAAIELGQWEEKHEHSGEVLVREYVGVDIEQV